MLSFPQWKAVDSQACSHLTLFQLKKLVPLPRLSDTKEPMLESQESTLNIFRKNFRLGRNQTFFFIAIMLCQNHILISFSAFH